MHIFENQNYVTNLGSILPFHPLKPQMLITNINTSPFLLSILLNLIPRIYTRVSIFYDVTEFSSHLHILRFYTTMVQSPFTMLANLGPKNIWHSMKMALLWVHNYISIKSTLVFGWIGY